MIDMPSRARRPSFLHKLCVAIFLTSAIPVPICFARFDDPKTQEDIRRCLNQGDPDGQITYCSKLINTFGLEDRSAASGWYWNRAHGYMNKNRFSESMADFNEAIRLRPGTFLWHVGRGRLYDKMNDSRAAIADFDEAIRLNPGGPDAFYFRGLVWERQGDKKKAVSDYLESVKRDRGYRPPLERLAVLMQNQKADAAPKCSASPEAALMNQKAQTLFNQGKLSEAEALLKKALALAEGSLGRDNPEVTNLLSNLGEICRREKKFDESRSYMDRALASSEKVSGPKSLRTAAALVDLALLDIDENRLESAKGYAERALAISRSQASKQVLLNFLLLFSEKYAERDQCSYAARLLSEATGVSRAQPNIVGAEAIQKIDRLSQRCGLPPMQKSLRQNATPPVSSEDGRPAKEKAFTCPGGKTGRLGGGSRQSGSICIQ